MSKGAPISALIDKATSEWLIHPDQSLFLACVEQLNARLEQPKEAMKAIRKRISNRNPKIQLLTLELISKLVDGCGLHVQIQIAGREFITILNSLAKSRDTDPEVHRRLRSLAQCWSEKYGTSRELSGFRELMRAIDPGLPQGSMLQLQDFRPRDDALSLSTSELPIRSVSEDFGYTRFSSEVTQRKASIPTSIPVQSRSEKLSKLQRDLVIVHDNVSLTHDILDESQPGTAVLTNEVLMELISTLKVMQGKLAKLIETTEDEEVLGESFAAKDEVDEAIERFDSMKRGERIERRKQELKPVECDLLSLHAEAAAVEPEEVPPQVKEQKPEVDDLRPLDNGSGLGFSLDSSVLKEEGKQEDDASRPPSLYTDLVEL